MNKQYENELKELKAQMVKAEKWADEMPIFRDEIINKKITGEEHSCKYGTKYKSIYLSWGLNRHFYENSKCVTNYDGDFEPIHLWRIYINVLSIYDSHERFDLEKVGAKDWFFYDESNTTFYVTDNQIEDLLESLNTWYLSAIGQLKERRKVERVKELEAELEELR